MKLFTLVHLLPWKLGVALTERNRTGPPRSVGHPTAHVPGGRPARSVTDDDRRRRQTMTTDASEQINTVPLGKLVITECPGPLTLKRRCKVRNSRSFSSPVVDEDNMKPGRWTRSVLLSFLQHVVRKKSASFIPTDPLSEKVEQEIIPRRYLSWKTTVKTVAVTLAVYRRSSLRYHENKLHTIRYIYVC